jgi:hypothetical protein
MCVDIQNIMAKRWRRLFMPHAARFQEGRNIMRFQKLLTLAVASMGVLAVGQSVRAATITGTTYKYNNTTPLTCCDTFDTASVTEPALSNNTPSDATGTYGSGLLNNGRIGFNQYSDNTAPDYRNNNTFAYQAEGIAATDTTNGGSAATESSGAYSDSNDFNLTFNLGAVYNNLSSVRIDYNTSPFAGFANPGDITISDGTNTVTILSSTLAAADNGVSGQRGTYNFATADISSLSGQFITIVAPNSGQYLGLNEVTFSTGGTPVPEPASLGLLSLAGLAALRRRRA